MIKIFKNSSPVSTLKKIKFPEKFKGTIVEKWADYWKNLFIDYRQMLQDLRADIQEDPKKAFKWGAGIASVVILARNNPNEFDFKDSLKRISNEVVLVNEKCINPKSVAHLRYLDTCFNQGVLHYRSLGIASIMYTSELNDECDLYKSQCSYLQPSYLSFPSRIVDVGFMGRWWNISMKTNNYDVNF